MADGGRYDIHVVHRDDDQGGYWDVWAHRLDPDGYLVREHVGSSSGCDLRSATHETFEAVVRHGERSDIDRARLALARAEQRVGELDFDVKAIRGQRNSALGRVKELEQRLAELQSGIGRIDP